MEKKGRLIILAHQGKYSNVGIYQDTGELVFNNTKKDIPRGIPVNLFLVDPNPYPSPRDYGEHGELSPGDLFVLGEDHDEVYYCTKVDGESVSGGVLIIEDVGYRIKKPIFEHFPIKNIRQVFGTSIRNTSLDIWTMEDKLIKELIENYNMTVNKI